MSAALAIVGEDQEEASKPQLTLLMPWNEPLPQYVQLHDLLICERVAKAGTQLSLQRGIAPPHRYHGLTVRREGEQRILTISEISPNFFWKLAQEAGAHKGLIPCYRRDMSSENEWVYQFRPSMPL